MVRCFLMKIAAFQPAKGAHLQVFFLKTVEMLRQHLERFQQGAPARLGNSMARQSQVLGVREGPLNPCRTCPNPAKPGPVLKENLQTVAPKLCDVQWTSFAGCAAAAVSLSPRRGSLAGFMARKQCKARTTWQGQNHGYPTEFQKPV